MTRLDPKTARVAREAEALRLNLSKRKQQQRSRLAAPAPRAADSGAAMGMAAETIGASTTDTTSCR